MESSVGKIYGTIGIQFFIFIFIYSKSDLKTGSSNMSSEVSYVHKALYNLSYTWHPATCSRILALWQTALVVLLFVLFHVERGVSWGEKAEKGKPVSVLNMRAPPPSSLCTHRLSSSIILSAPSAYGPQQTHQSPASGRQKWIYLVALITYKLLIFTPPVHLLRLKPEFLLTTYSWILIMFHGLDGNGGLFSFWNRSCYICGSVTMEICHLQTFSSLTVHFEA